VLQSNSFVYCSVDHKTLNSIMAQCSPTSRDRQLSAYNYHLPAALIAQNPVTPRDSSRLLVVKEAVAEKAVAEKAVAEKAVAEKAQNYQHRHFRDLAELLLPGDLLVLNNTRVIPARLFGRKQIDTFRSNTSPADDLLNETRSGAQSTYSVGSAVVEVLLIEPIDADRWLALVKPGRRLQPGATIVFGEPESPMMHALVESRDESTNGRVLRLIPQGDRTIEEIIYQLGQIPLPPYITQSNSLPEQYQTIYARKQSQRTGTSLGEKSAENPSTASLVGSVAAPTAGLHFTDRLLTELAEKNIQTAEVTLHVGIGTFRPVEVSDIETHQMHQERIEVPAATVEKIQQTKANGGRVIAVGTTSTRALEGAAAISGKLQPYNGKTELFIYPGYQWRVIDGLITNFHLPGSSLMMMVSALIGRERLLALYEVAIQSEYRFYSFGDAMLILPEATLNRQTTAQ